MEAVEIAFRVDFTHPWDYSDVTFIIEGKRIYASKAVLGMCSEVFKTMFTSDFAEKKMAEIPLPDKKFDNFLQLMQILHPQVDQSVNEANVELMLPLAHEYQMHHVVNRCEKYLLTQKPSVHNLVLADKYSLSQLRQVCIEYMKTTQYSTLEEDQEFDMVHKDILFEIFQYKLRQGKYPSQGVIYKLLSEPPSIQNLFLAEKHDVPEVYEKCMQYLKDTPWSELEIEAGFSELCVDTITKVLTYKAQQIETLKSEITHMTNWGKLEKQEVCSGTSNQGNMVLGGFHGQQVSQHIKGDDKNCKKCLEHRLAEIDSIVKRC